MPARFINYCEPFLSVPPLDARVHEVLCALPDEVQTDFLEDSSFRVTLEDLTPDGRWQMFMDFPGRHGVSRCVVLRHKLATAPSAFALYIIAHEFAHAYLRNGGWGEITDPELAADALAASWGFPKPY